MKHLTAFALMPMLLSVSSTVISQTSHASAQSEPRPAVAADNSKSNKVDPSNHNPVADDQKNNASDLKIAQTIRSNVMADKALSTYAHNAKIVSVNGTVTLNGVVRTQSESTQLAEKAAQVVGSDHVINKLKVEPAQKD